MVRRGPLKRWQRRWKDGWVGDLDAPGARRNAAIDMLVFDHGLMRKALAQRARGGRRGLAVEPAEPGAIRRLAGQGFKAVLNLRGATEFGSYLLEREACRAAGMELVDFKLTSRALPSREEILALDGVFARLPRPFLMHCKSGADRAGFAAALYLMLQQGASPEEAQAAALLALPSRARGGDRGAALPAGAVRGGERGGADAFPEWVATRYDPEALMAAYRSGGAADFVVDKVLRRE